MSDEFDPLDPHDPGLTGADLPPLDPALRDWLAADAVGPMPDDVWMRIEAALAAEPPLTEAPMQAAGATVTDLSAARARRSRLWPVLAGAAGVALVGLVALPALRGGETPVVVADGPVTAEAAVALGAPDSTDGESGESASGGDAPGSDLQAPAASPTPSADAGPDEAAGQATGSPGEPMTLIPLAMLDSGTAYTDASMPQQVNTLLAATGMTDRSGMARALSASPTPTPTPMTGQGMFANHEALSDCLLRLGLPESAAPVVVDHGAFDGRDAGVVVSVGAFGSDGLPSDLHVVAVGSECDEAAVAEARHWDMPMPAAS